MEALKTSGVVGTFKKAKKKKKSKEREPYQFNIDMTRLICFGRKKINQAADFIWYPVHTKKSDE